jgi:hypothetical protein
MELEIKKYLLLIATLIVSFLLIYNYSTQVKPKKEAYAWAIASHNTVTATVASSPKTFISHQDGQTTITWTGYSQPVDIQKCLSLESGSWTTISKNNSSGKFVDTDAKEPMAFYRISYTAQL